MTTSRIGKVFVCLCLFAIWELSFIPAAPQPALAQGSLQELIDTARNHSDWSGIVTLTIPYEKLVIFPRESQSSE